MTGHLQASGRLFFVFCWATSRTTRGFLFSFGVQGFKSLEFLLFLQLSALISGFSLVIIDLSGIFFGGRLIFTPSLRCPSFTGCLLT